MVVNKHLKDFQSLSSLAISGERQSGKLTLALYFASQLTDKPVTLISPFNKVFLDKKINTSLDINSNLQPVLTNIIPISLKDDWKSIKNDFGYDFLLKDIERINAEAREVVIFHRIDEFFEIQGSNDIENFLFNVITIAQIAEKTIIFTVNMGHENSRYIYEYFERNIDSEFAIAKSEHESNVRHVELVSSLLSSEHLNLSFELNETTNNFELFPIEDNVKDEQKKQCYRIVLASQSSELLEIVSFLFAGNEFELVQIKPILTEVMKELLDETHLIIFNSFSQQLPDEFKEIGQVISSSRKKALFVPSKIIRRRSDKSQILQSGFFNVQEKEFYIEDFVSAVECALGYPFYTNKMNKIPDKTYLTHDKSTLTGFITALLKNNLFFTVFTFKYQPPLCEKQLKKNLGRSFDVAFINKEEQVLYILLVNTLARNASTIEAKFSAITQGIEMTGYKDATKYKLDFKV